MAITDLVSNNLYFKNIEAIRTKKEPASADRRNQRHIMSIKLRSKISYFTIKILLLLNFYLSCILNR